MADLRMRPDRAAQASGGFVTWTTGNLSAGRRLWRLITEPSRSLGMRLLAHVILAKIELTNGRWRAAQAELESAETMDAVLALEHRAFYALTRFLSAPDSELIVLRDSLRDWDPIEASAEGDGVFGHRGLHPYIRLYLLGLLSAHLRDEPAARRYVAELERVDRSSPLGRFAADKARSIRSELAWLGGRRQEALRYWWGRGSGPTIPGWSRQVTHRSPPTSTSGLPAPSCYTSLDVMRRRSALVSGPGVRSPLYRAGPSPAGPDLRAPGRATEGHRALLPLPRAVAGLRPGASAAGAAGAAGAGSASVNGAANSSGMG